MSSSSPDVGTDSGIGRSNAKGPTVTARGCTFPVGFTFVVSDPLIAVSPRAWSAETTDAGRVSWTW